MAEVLKVRIEKLEKSIPPSVSSRNKKRKFPRKGKPPPSKCSTNEDLGNEENGKKLQVPWHVWTHY